MTDVTSVRSYEGPDGTRLAYLDQGVGPVVVLLHALQANAQANWVDTGVVAALLEAGYRVVAPDARGHGRSDAPDYAGAYAPDVLAADVRALLTQLGVESPSIVGYSYGARTAALLAAQGLAARSLVLGGVAMSSFMPMPATPESDAVLASLTAGADAEGGAPDPMRELMAAWNIRPLAVAAIFRELRTAPAVELGVIKIPVLLVHSAVEPDDVVTEIAGARSVIVAGDHVTAPMDPAFTNAIVDFLADAAPAS